MKVLVVVDVQNDFIDGALHNPEAIVAVPKIVEHIKNSDADMIVFTQDTHDENYMNTAEGFHLPVPHCIKGTHGWEIHADVLAAAGKFGVGRFLFLEKRNFGAPHLPGAIATRSVEKVTEIEMLGFCTDVCILSNAAILKSSPLTAETPITVIGNLCAGVSPLKHDAALAVLNSIQVIVK